MHTLSTYGRLSRILTTWPFVVSIALLIINDFCLKRAFPVSRPMFLIPVVVATVFGITATSMVPYKREIRAASSTPAHAISAYSIAGALAQLARKRDMRCIDCAAPEITARYAGDNASFTYVFDD